MVELVLLPLFGGVAVLAFFPVAPFVDIIVFMTSVAGLWHLLLIEPFTVTSIAINLLVLEFKRKVRLVMIKLITLPLLCSVTIRTFFSITSVVNVIKLVTCIAVFRCLFITFV